MLRLEVFPDTGGLALLRWFLGTCMVLCLLCVQQAWALDLDLDLDLGADFLAPKSPFEFSGYLKNETAYRIDEPRSFTKIRNLFYGNEVVTLASWSKFTVNGWAYHDLVYDLFDYDTISARYERDADQPLNFIENLPQEKDSDVAEIREIYLDFFSDFADLRIGKQFVVWGVLTGVRVIDEINPLDFRELIMPDLIDYRIPLWTVKLDIYNSWFNTQLLWIPELRFHKPAPPGSEWELLQEVPGTKYPENFTLENSEYGAQIEFEILNTELTLNYFYTWDDFPVIFRDVRLNSSAEDDVVFRPRFTRMEMFGGTFRRTVFGQIFKGEAAYIRGKYFGIGRVDRNRDGYIDSQGVIQRDHVRYGLGLDFSFFGADVSPGFTQTVVLEHDPAIIQPPVETAFNLFIRKSLAPRVLLEFLAIYLPNIRENYYKPKTVFLLTDKFSVAVGADIFSGSNSSSGIISVKGSTTDLKLVPQRSRFIGNFSDNDRIFVDFKYSF